MRIEALSIRTVTIIIFMMIGLVAVVLSLFAGSYFRQAALDAQMSSLSRVIEVASQEMLREVRGYTFDLGMRLGHSSELIQAINKPVQPGVSGRLTELLDDPFINGFVGASNIKLEKIRVYDLELRLIGESNKGIAELEPKLNSHLVDAVNERRGVERLKAVDALWLSKHGPLYSTLVPVGGLRQTGYLEVIVNPVFNLPDIGNITKTPISVFSAAGEQISIGEQGDVTGYLPVEYIMHTSAGESAFRIVGHENVESLNAEMEKTQVVTVGGFLMLTLSTLLFALWLFNRFLFVPVRRMIRDMKLMASGKLDLTVNKKGLRDFSILAETFDAMANQVRTRTNDLERLLDLDDSAILCFGNDNEAVYFNRGAASLFGYSTDEISDLDLADIFSDDIVQMMEEPAQSTGSVQVKLHTRLDCRRKGGQVFQSDAVVRSLDMLGGHGYAVVLNPLPASRLLSENVVSSIEQNEQRMKAVEQSLNSILEMARHNPGLVSGPANMEMLAPQAAESGTEKSMLRESVVNVMCSALACWEHDLDRSKLDLAEASKIWPVYIDKSTPTTRTLDKYLNIDSCPKNPRNQRVIDTAEFVLKQLHKKTTTERKKLQQALDEFRLLIAGIR